MQGEGGWGVRKEKKKKKKKKREGERVCIIHNLLMSFLEKKKG